VSDERDLQDEEQESSEEVEAHKKAAWGPSEDPGWHSRSDDDDEDEVEGHIKER
jgi:hypothetical protein